MNPVALLVAFVVTVSIANIIRMMIYLVGGDIYAIKRSQREKANESPTLFEPSVSIIVPAHNEEPVIEGTIACLLEIDYPLDKLEIIIANDGSIDRTLEVAQNYIGSRDADDRVKVLSQSNHGKAAVLNNAIKNVATSKLIMCLDADSLIAPDGIRKAVQYFKNTRVVALASNVNIIENKTILGLAQRFEYLISYNMKKAQTAYNIEYIIGGIGSMFRRDMLEAVNYYDTNTMTEDIDLTMKIIAKGNKKYKVAYADDCITYTEPVKSLKALISQRYRWKYGRMQTFLKNIGVFFSSNKHQSKWLTWFVLPQSLIQEVFFLLEPLVVTFIIAVSIIFQDPLIMLTALLIITGYILINLWSSSHLSIKDRVRLSFYTPPMYVLLYLLSIAEYCALVKSLFHLKRLRQSINKEQTTWVSPQRNAHVDR